MANNTDLIDKYLLGDLSNVEKKQFEDTLSDPLEGKVLKREVELQKEIIMAIQARGLKEQLQAKEQQMRAKRSKIQKIVKITSWSTSVSLMAAIMLLAIVVVPMVKVMKQESMMYINAEVSMGVTRGNAGEGVEGDKQALHNLLAQSQIVQANEQAKSLLIKLASMQAEMDEEEYRYHYDEVLWLHANCEMNLGHVFTAKRLLKQIASEGGAFASQAQEILDKL